MTRGYHNRNFRVALTDSMARLVGREPGVSVTVRRRLPDPSPVVIRTWQDESQILDAIHDALPHVPQCLGKYGDTAVHSYVEGVPLSSICQNGKPVDSRLIGALAELLAQMVRVRREDLPDLPPNWPDNKDSRSFLRTLALRTEQQVRRPNWTEFGGLFAALGIPEDAMTRFAERVPPMARRPFSLLHTDLHRDNVIVSYQGSLPLICVDWELATYGDPLHDLATHLVRMRYPDSQWQEVKDAWYRAMRQVRPTAVSGIETDLRHYLAFERAQSVFPDVIRAAKSLGDEQDPAGLEEAAESVVHALRAARDPLRLGREPRQGEVEGILYRWHAARPGRRARRTGPIDYVRATGLPQEVVGEALVAEGAARADQVYKGTGHLNTVVRVRGLPEPVVVRRKLPSASSRREPCFLEEHVVLRALDTAGCRVRVPTVLARGTSERGNRFELHTYVGPHDPLRPPSHPVAGLRLNEADDLVDQLCALAEADLGHLDPTVADGTFYEWLSDQLVGLVAALPKESMRLARVLGLPDAHRLKEILRTRAVTPRRRVLLHGDLNPWNLVRDEESRGLVIIDWEMAMVGDPLYDLVRHLHLTPHSAEIRQRMFERWGAKLSEEYTRGWATDAHTYRWIETVRSAYVDLDRLVTGSDLDAPNVRRAVDSYAVTLSAARASLGLRGAHTSNPYLALALPQGDHVMSGVSELSLVRPVQGFMGKAGGRAWLGEDRTMVPAAGSGPA
ncbi:aminoglycoside phosphotransferase family protein [Streptomyces sp. GC420]|uniref:aminoglycoside phosphotransferase family protein n=1 Tax=Streptomyces sp. GC420 TaxID=2697568 RepID=UPI0014151DAE|nr:phosphotransferase [Streptomyces sp. GC420]